MSQSSRTAAITSKQSRLYSDNETRFSDSSAATSSTIRPRNRRLISTEQELVSTTSSRRSSPGGSARGVSPIPSRHPSRREGDNRAQSAESALGTSAWVVEFLEYITRTCEFGARGLGDLVTDEGEGGARKTVSLDRPKARRKDSSVKKLFELPHGAWGPAEQKKRNEAVIGSGSQSERDAALRTQKMMRLLENHTDLNGAIDTNGNYKRRTSMDEATTRTQDDEGDALVYIHHVQKEDTLAGVILRYNCQPMVFRKANRFWPNDSIQTRQVVVLPVDACAIKGRPCDPSQDLSQGIDLLAPTPSLEDAPEVWPPRSETPTERPEENPWEHVRWVLLDSSPNSKPVEIARMPRRTLGYFPPRRRKSQATNSITSTPRGSFDLPRGSSGEQVSSPASTTSRRTSNLGPRPSQSTGGSYFPPIGSANRSRRESASEAADRLGWLRGPGGVGTLGKGVTTPGPGQDPLNTWARKHIPGITIDSLSSSSILESELPFGFRDELASIAEGSYSPASGSATPSNLGALELVWKMQQRRLKVGLEDWLLKPRDTKWRRYVDGWTW
ncbi:LysM domain-containing protein [Botrytis cinerea]